MPQAWLLHHQVDNSKRVKYVGMGTWPRDEKEAMINRRLPAPRQKVLSVALITSEYLFLAILEMIRQKLIDSKCNFWMQEDVYIPSTTNYSQKLNATVVNSFEFNLLSIKSKAGVVIPVYFILSSPAYFQVSGGKHKKKTTSDDTASLTESCSCTSRHLLDRFQKPNCVTNLLSIFCCLLLNPWRLVFLVFSGNFIPGLEYLNFWTLTCKTPPG